MKRTRVGLVLIALAAVCASGAQAQRFGPQLSWSDDFDFGLGARVEVPFQGLLANQGPFFRTFGMASFDYFQIVMAASPGPTSTARTGS